MSQLFIDEDIPRPIALMLRQFGHDVVTTEDAGRKSAGDPSQLAYAASIGRIIITHNMKDYKRLHRHVPGHSGIIASTREDTNHAGVAQRIHQRLIAEPDMKGKLILVYRPA